MQTARKFSSHQDQPSIIELQKRTFKDSQLTLSQKSVLNSLRLYIGYDGKKRASIKRIAEMVSLKESRTREILSSLVNMGRLNRVERLGHCNEWSIPDQTPTETRPLLRPIKKEENVKNQKPKANVISISSQEQPKEPEPQTDTHKTDNKPVDDHKPKKTPIRMDIVKALVEITNDKRSFGLWCKVARDVPLDDIRYSVEALRIAQNDNSVRNSGRYITSILKSRCPEVFTHKTASVSHFATNERSITHANKATAPVPLVKKTPLEPVIEPKQDYKTGLEAIAQIMAMLNSQPFSIEARERQREAGIEHQGNLNNNPRLPQKVAELDKPNKNRDNESAVQAARLVGSNKQYVKDAKKIAAANPDVLLGWEVKHDQV